MVQACPNHQPDMYMYIHVWVPRFNHQNIGIQRIPVGGSVHFCGTGILSGSELSHESHWGYSI